MALITFRNVGVRYGSHTIFEQVGFRIERSERICLVGRNGSGKSTLMKILCSEIPADEGEVTRMQNLRVERLVQEVPRDLSGDVYDQVALGLGEQSKLLAEYHRVSHELQTNHDEALLKELERLQHQLEDADAWTSQQKVEAVISRLSLDPDAECSKLSAGLKRRVLLAQALVREPDILLLDEPTNHLDVDSIVWLEEFLKRYNGTLVFVTHDRLFLQRLSTRILEIDRGRLSNWDCDYNTYLERKQAALEAEQHQQHLFDKKLAEEEVWIRKGIQGRRTRNEGRVRALKTLREERRSRRDQVGKARIQVDQSQTSGALVIEAKGISHKFGDQPIVSDLSITVMRGDRIGIIGPNGVGKTTLLRILLGQMESDAGSVRLGTRLEIAYFDQLHMALDESKSVKDNVGLGYDNLNIGGKQRHIFSYLQDFLFTPEQARGQITNLSGGERNRLMLAKLFSQPANVLVLDEPTNDLDVETLEVLEERLLEFKGTILVVSHDRAFLNNVVTSTLVFEGQGNVKEYIGGYDDWQRQVKAKAKEEEQIKAKESKSAETTASRKNRDRKLSYKEQRELDSLPQRIEDLESEQASIHETMADPGFYQQAKDKIVEATSRLETIEQQLATAYERWEELESLM